MEPIAEEPAPRPDFVGLVRAGGAAQRVKPREEGPLALQITEA